MNDNGVVAVAAIRVSGETVSEEDKLNTGDTDNTPEETNAVVQTRTHGFRKKKISGD